jgi:hypothetical protein
MDIICAGCGRHIPSIEAAREHSWQCEKTSPSASIHWIPAPKSKITPEEWEELMKLIKADGLTERRWCSRCKDNTNMRIGFVNKRPAFGTCPQCHTLWDLRRHDSNIVNADEITPDVKRRLDELRKKKRNKPKHKK